MNSAIKETVDHLMDTASYEAVTVFDRCTVVVAELEDGRIMLEACGSETAEKHDAEAAVEVCLQKLMGRVQMMVEEEEERSFTLTEAQAKTIIAWASHGMRKKSAAGELGITSSSMSGRLETIREKTGRDPEDFFQLCELLAAARDVLVEG